MIKRKIILRRKVEKGHVENVTTKTTTKAYVDLPPDHSPEELFAETLNVLFDGMAKGNQIDKKAAEALIKSIHYKTNPDFYEECLSVYEEALKIHEKTLSENIVMKITRNLSDFVDRGMEEIKKITQKIILSYPPPSQENQ